MYGTNHKRRTKTSFRRTNDIEALSERLKSLQITNEASEEYKQSDTEMLTAPVPVPMMNNGQAAMPKSMVPNLG